MKLKFEEQMLEPAIIESLSYVKKYVYHESELITATRVQNLLLFCPLAKWLVILPSNILPLSFSGLVKQI